MSSAATVLWQIGNKQVIDAGRPRIMAIVNATPDSFYAGSRIADSTAAQAEELAVLAAAGPDIIDIGGQSTRPGSARVGAVEELARVLPLIEALRATAPQIPLSIDTYHSWVAREALAAGATIVNDVSAGAHDAALLDVVAGSGCGYVLMHMQGTPETMQQAPQYSDCVTELQDFFAAQLAALAARGIAAERVVLDPGIGFGKRVEDNLALIRGATELARLGRPLLYGVSRKSFIGKLAPDGDPALDDAAERLPGTLGLSWELLSRGVMLHRVHDVAATRQLMALWEAVRSEAPLRS